MISAYDSKAVSLDAMHVGTELIPTSRTADKDANEAFTFLHEAYAVRYLSKMQRVDVGG